MNVENIKIYINIYINPPSLPPFMLQSPVFGKELVFPCFPQVRVFAGALRDHWDHAKLTTPLVGWVGCRAEIQWIWNFWQGGTRVFLACWENRGENTLFYYLSIFVCVRFCLWLTKKKKKSDKTCLAGIHVLIKSCHLSQKKWELTNFLEQDKPSRLNSFWPPLFCTMSLVTSRDGGERGC